MVGYAHQLETTRVTDLKTLNLQELEVLCRDLGIEKFRAVQLFEWMYRRGADSYDAMTNISKDLRARLAEAAELRPLVVADRQVSKDGTSKYLFRLHDGNRVEAVLIPEFFDDGVADRLTVCVSSQVGCMFGCAFCATGRMGFIRNLSAGEIAEQVVRINLDAEAAYGKRITNIVYMGMGEPLHNYQQVMRSIDILTHPKSIGLSPKRVTVSSVGLAKQIRQLADEGRTFRLAISLHAPSDVKRNRIMPINTSLDLGALKDAVRHYFAKTKLDVTYEYLLFQEFNDSAEDAKQLAAITKWVPSKVNVIMYNNVAGVELKRAGEDRLNAFLRELTRAGARATVRRSRGDDIDAGCGQLAIREGQPRGKSLSAS